MDHEQIRQLLTRAQEIQTHQLTGDEAEAELEQVVAAATETGLSREAVMQALRERTNLADRPIEHNALVFAPGAGKHLYVAQVKSVDEGLVSVKFLSGGEATFPKSQIRSLDMLPGKKLGCQWQGWGWWNSTVLTFDAENKRVFATDGWGQNQFFSLSDVRLDQETDPQPGRARQWVFYLAVSLGSGALGALLMRLFMR